MPAPIRNVKGVLFADYVRMIRNQKGVDFTAVLTAEDLFYLKQRIEPEQWYPMTSFERLGNAIFAAVANNDLQAVRMWGRFSVDALRTAQPMLLAENDPIETLNRFRVLRATYFDFEAIELPMLMEDQAHVVITYGMGPRAEEAASYQAMGFFERLLELAGAKGVSAHFLECGWAGDPRTLIELNWKPW